MTAVSVDGQLPAYRDSGLPVDQRVESLLTMMTLEEKVAQLGSAWVFQLTQDGRFSPRKGPEVCSAKVSGTSPGSQGPATCGAGGGAPRQRDPALPARGDPARHPSHRPRGDLLRAHGQRRRRLPPGDRRRRHLGAQTRPRHGRHGPSSDEAMGAHHGSVPRARRCQGPAMGPHRGDLRGGPVSRRPAWERPSSTGCRARI